MLARIHSSALHGVEVVPVSVEVDLSAGLPGFSIVGLPDRVIRESIVRVRAALRNSGFRFPRQKITVSLAPAGMPKEGPVFDLPIALGILIASGQLDQKMLSQKTIVGELALNGSLCSVRGILPRMIHLSRLKGWHAVIPAANIPEAVSVKGVPTWGVSNLCKAVYCLQEGKPPDRKRAGRAPAKQTSKTAIHDFSYVRGQMQAKRGLLIAAAGGHNVLLVGPPGVGKTMLARCLPGILTSLTSHEILETSQIHSVAGLFRSASHLVQERPFRAPHHTASMAALAGGGAGVPRPGEVSFAHNGILFLDELPEFRRDALEVLRQPLEEGRVRISRACGHFSFPARFMLVASMNPCPCGYYGTEKECLCTDYEVRRYRGRLSGPLADRIDMHLNVPLIHAADLSNGVKGDASSVMHDRVVRSRTHQIKRYRSLNRSGFLNAHLDIRMIERFCMPDKEGANLLHQAMDKMGLSVRAYHRVLKVSRTIADLEDAQAVCAHHIAEAISYRILDRNLRP